MLHLSGLVSIFHPDVSSKNYLHLNCRLVESSILVLDKKHKDNENMLFSLLVACSGVAFESQKLSPASRADKILFFCFCWKVILILKIFLTQI